jgi:hypothetical protein
MTTLIPKYDQGATGAVNRPFDQKLAESVSVLDFGADRTGVTSSTTAFQNAINSLTSGGQIVVPAGTYYLATTVTVNNNITFIGQGTASIITSNAATTLSNTVDGSFCASSKSNIAFKDLKFTCRTTGNFRIKLILCSNVVIDGCYFTGDLTSGELAEQCVYVGGSANVTVQNTTFLNWRDAVYICKDNHSTGTSSGYVAVTNSFFEQINHGLNHRYPTGVYVYFGEDTLVTNCTFKNIKPSLIDPSYAGYGVYEGDGTSLSVTVNGCKFIDDDGIVTSASRGVAFQEADQGQVTGCYFSGLTEGFAYAAINTEIVGNTFANCKQAITAYSSGILPQSLLISSNNIVTCPGGNGIQVGGTGNANFVSCLISNNYIKNCLTAGISIQEANYSQIIGNTIIDCNTSDGTSTDFNIGISYYGPVYGFVDGNSVINTATGKMRYGISGYATSYNIIVTQNNYIKDMITGATFNTRVAAPTFGTWMQGTKFYYWNATSGSVEGTVCTVTSKSTTGTIASSSNSLTVASGTGFTNGNYITVTGAGAAGADLITTITSGGGTTTLVLGATASTSVTGAVVTTAGTWKNYGVIA